MHVLKINNDLIYLLTFSRNVVVAWFIFGLICFYLIVFINCKADIDMSDRISWFLCINLTIHTKIEKQSETYKLLLKFNLKSCEDI